MLRYTPVKPSYSSDYCAPNPHARVVSDVPAHRNPFADCARDTPEFDSRELDPYASLMSRENRYGSMAVKTYRLIIDPLIRPLRPKVVDLCHDLGVKTILDIASGTGAQCRLLGENDMMATGLDLSEDMVAHAQAQGGCNTRYVQGSAYKLPFNDASFEASLLVLALHEHPEEDRARMLGEALRVAARYVVIADYERPRNATTSPSWQLIRFIEHSAGREHNAGFKHFVTNGCLRGLTERHALIIEQDQTSHYGTMRIVALRASERQTLA